MILGVTGHRPDKLPNIDAVHAAISLKLHELRPQRVYTGMAIGVDQIVAAKCIGFDIPFIAVVPFIGQERLWPKAVQAEYKNLLRYAADTIVVSPAGYSFEKMHKRNRWIVDHCDSLFAVWDGSSGGTANTVQYALKRGWAFGDKIIRLDPRKL